MTTATYRGKAIALWSLRIALAALFLFAAFMKITGQQMMIAEFGQVGLGQWFRYFTGALELIGAVALLVPRVSVLGALLLLLVDFGAFVAQLGVLHGDWIHTIVIGLLLALVVYLQRAKLSAAGQGNFLATRSGSGTKAEGMLS